MAFQKLRPMLCTWDLSRTIEFYTETLGFECEARNEEWIWASLRRDDVVLMVSGPGDHRVETSPGFTGSIYITCDNVDELWLSLKDRVKVCYPLETFHYGMREFGIYDINGYLLQFGQPADAAASAEAAR